jgi:sugar O-acyltransferase (sialic acid O-acetyltransferase NeuD family)
VKKLRTLVGIYGAGGFGRETMPLVRGSLGHGDAKELELVYVDDIVEETLINGVPVLRYSEFVRRKAKSKLFNVAVADSKYREDLANKCLADGASPMAIRASTNLTYESAALGPGAILCPFTVITANVRVGKFFHANLFSYVAHDCEIGDFVTFSPGVKCNGHVVIEDHAFIGSGAILGPGRKGAPLVVGRGATVAAGAVVMRNVAAGTTVLGNPARTLPASNC